MSTSLTTQQRSLRSQVEKNLNVMRGEFQKALPKHLSSDKFARIVLTEVTKNPKLLECNQTSFFCSLLLAAQLGLEVGVNGSCYIIPYKTEATFVIGFRGMMDLIRRSGIVKNMHVELVYDNDEFSIELGLSQNIKHIPKLDGDRGEVKLGYSVATFNDGSVDFIWMTRAELNDVRKSSKSGNSGPWMSHTTEMFKKTLIRRHAKMLPMSMEIHSAISTDETVKKEFKEDMIETQAGETLEEVEAAIIEETQAKRASNEDKAQFYDAVTKKGLAHLITADETLKITGGCEFDWLSNLAKVVLPARLKPTSNNDLTSDLFEDKLC